MPKQLTWREAEEIGKKAALRAIGFGPEKGKVTIDASEVVRVAQDAAVIALREAGNLTENDAKERRLIDMHADAADKRHEAWKKSQRRR